MTEARPFHVALLTDEPGASDAARRALRAHRELEVVLEVPCSGTTLLALDGADVDLAILLIGRLDPEVVEGLESIRRRGTTVVLSSSEPADAVLAYEMGAVDFVPRPIESPRMGLALDRARRRLESGSERNGSRERAGRASGSGGHVSRIVARSRNRWVVIRSDEIRRIEANRNYVRVHAGGSPMRVRQTIRELETMLDPVQFFRVHRSFIVRLDEVFELSALRDGDYQLVLRDGAKVPLSRSRREAFFEALSRRTPEVESFLRAG